MVIGTLEGITGLHLQPLVWAIPVGIVALIMGGMAFMFPTLIAAFTPMWVADQVSIHQQVKRAKQDKRIPKAGDPCARCTHRSETGDDFANEYGRFVFCIDKTLCAKRAQAQGINA